MGDDCVCGHDRNEHDEDGDCARCGCDRFTPAASEPKEPGYVFD